MTSFKTALNRLVTHSSISGVAPEPKRLSASDKKTTDLGGNKLPGPNDTSEADRTFEASLKKWEEETDDVDTIRRTVMRIYFGQDENESSALEESTNSEGAITSSDSSSDKESDCSDRPEVKSPVDPSQKHLAAKKMRKVYYKRKKFLNLSSLRLMTLPSAIGCLKSLKGLRLDWNCLSAIPSEIGELHNLQYLNLDRNYQLMGLPKELWSLSELRRLRLDHTGVYTIDDDIEKLTKLKFLSVKYSCAVEPPRTLAKLPELTHIFHYGSHWTKEFIEEVGVPRTDIVGALRNHASSRVFEDSLRKWEEETEDSNALRQTYLYTGGDESHFLRESFDSGSASPSNDSFSDEDSDCSTWSEDESPEAPLQMALVEAPPKRALAATRIRRTFYGDGTSLDLSGLNLWTLPSAIGCLKYLKRLDLNSNNLLALPPEIGSLQNLQSLYLTDNCLSELPPEIGSLTGLKNLSLDRSGSYTIPNDIEKRGCKIWEK